jgi:hypothetical protein
MCTRVAIAQERGEVHDTRDTCVLCGRYHGFLPHDGVAFLVEQFDAGEVVSLYGGHQRVWIIARLAVGECDLEAAGLAGAGGNVCGVDPEWHTRLHVGA